MSEGSSTPKPILGESHALQQLLKLVAKVAASKTNILITGESGTGKELVARMIHDTGVLKDGPFVPVNCGAIPENLIESELFGHQKGSFTGAIADKLGLFEVAEGGTLFLDEIGELPLPMQVKILRALQERIIRRVGSNEDIKVDARIISATNRDLEVEIREGRFREDLYYRINVIQVKTPPLRERGGDIRLLAESFLKRYGERHGKHNLTYDPEVLNLFERYPWPGNIRELENIVERAATLTVGSNVEKSYLPTNLLQSQSGSPVMETTLSAQEIQDNQTFESSPQAAEISPTTKGMFLPDPDFSKGPIQIEKIIEQVENYYLNKALAHSGGIKKEAARLLGITFRSIRYRLGKNGE